MNLNTCDIIQPFSLEKSGLRGRMVKMDSILKQIIEQHSYPLPVSYLLSETLTLSLLLSSMLKYEGIFSLQIQAEGSVKTIITDINAEGEIRAYASFDAEALDKINFQPDNQNYFSLLEKGYMAFTVNQGENSERYQGIVELNGDSLTSSVQHYFDKSEQIQTCIRMAISPQDDQWHTGAIMLQYMPDSKPIAVDDMERKEERQEDWNRACIFLNSCKDEELLSPHAEPTDLLYKLFHEEGVRAYPTTKIKHSCRCSQERVDSVLKSLSKEDLADAQKEDGSIDMTCEFCGKVYIFTKQDIDKL